MPSKEKEASNPPKSAIRYHEVEQLIIYNSYQKEEQASIHRGINCI